MNNLTLYKLIKQKTKEKGRPLKIICDWDDTIQPLKPLLFYKQISMKGRIKINFKEFFEDFWENIPITYFSHGTQIKSETPEGYTLKFLTKQDIEEFENSKEKRKMDENDPLFNDPELYDNYLLLNAEGLLSALKEDLIKELVIISSYREGGKWVKADCPGGDPRKRKSYERTFGKFPQSKFEFTKVVKGPDGRLRPHRWEVIRDKFPDFDIYIDDNYSLIAGSKSTISLMKEIPSISDKTYVLTDYKSNRKTTGPNIYHVKTTVSDITPRDFALGALETRINKLTKLEQEIKEKTKTSLNSNAAILFGLLIGILLLVSFRKRKKFE